MNEKTTFSDDRLKLAPFQLSDVRLFEIKVERCDSKDIVDELQFQADLESTDIKEDDNSFLLKVNLQTKIPDGKDSICELELSVEARFHPIVDIDTIKKEFLDDFRSRTGFFILWPYVRQYLHDITSRLRLGIPPLPMIDMTNPPNTD